MKKKNAVLLLVFILMISIVPFNLFAQEAVMQPDLSEKFSVKNTQSQTVFIGSTDPNSGYKFALELTSAGAAVKNAFMSEYGNRNIKDPQPLAILSPAVDVLGNEFNSMANTSFSFVRQNQELPLNRLNWKSSAVRRTRDGETVSFEAMIFDAVTGNNVVKILKTYRVHKDSYTLDCDVSVENIGIKAQDISFNMTGPIGIGKEATRMEGRMIVGGFISKKSSEVVPAYSKIQSGIFDRFKKKYGLKDSTQQYIDALRGGNKSYIETARTNLRVNKTLRNSEKDAAFLWCAIVNKYFAAAVIPQADQDKQHCDWISINSGGRYFEDTTPGKTGTDTIGIDLLETVTMRLAPADQVGSLKNYRFKVFLGPKSKPLFDNDPYYRELGLINTIKFLACCCPAAFINPLAFAILSAMSWIYGIIPNYGVVIIILVLFIRLCLHPITKKSQISMNKMTKLSPKMAELKIKYANNKTELNKQTMALYREQEASPVMGFLPMLVQMPIWIALYSAIYASIELRGKPFLPFWITDLSAPDALISFSAITIPILGAKISSFNLLPILMGVAMYFQQKMMPKNPASAANPQAAQQQKMMMIMMPLMFPLMLYSAPSGLNLYIMSSTFAGVLEQHIIRKHIREREEAESMGKVAVTSKTGGRAKKKKPKPFFKTK